MPEYQHQEPGTEVRFIAGHYTIVEERRIIHHSREILIVVGIAAVESYLLRHPGVPFCERARLRCRLETPSDRNRPARERGRNH